MAECDLRLHPPQRRSSSQTSSSSRHSQKAKTVRTKAQKRHSASNATESETDLTSFPSLSPDRSPQGFQGQPALNRALTSALLNGGDGTGSAMDLTRDRKATLAKLTTGSQNSGRAALFEDSFPVRDFPGALHLADDAHIERLIANNGAVRMVRQFARDLAQRDAEISALRQRTDARERELKRMLREASVSNKDIERRLYELENSEKNGNDQENDPEQTVKGSTGVGGLMQQAMIDGVGSHLRSSDGEDEDDLNTVVQTTSRKPFRVESDAKSGTSSVDSGVPNRKRQGSVRSWQDFFFGSAAGSRKTSRASSIMSDLGEDEEDGTRQQVPSTNAPSRRKPLDDQLIQPVEGQPGRDDFSTHSRKSSKSVSSWTVKLFAGNQSSRDESPADKNRGRASSTNRDRNRGPPPALPATKHGMSAVATLRRINSNTSIQGAQGRPNGSGTSPRSGQLGRRQPASSVSQGATAEVSAKNPTNLGPVEMDAILPMESRPPALSSIYNNDLGGDLLTDRFGFIYDQRRKRRQREASLFKNNGNRLSITETLNTFRSDASDDYDEPSSGAQPPSAAESRRSSGQGSPVDPETSSRRWQDYLTVPSAPTELLSHTPSAGPIVSLTTGGEDPPRNSGVVDKRGSVSVNSNSQPSASTSTVVADRPEFAGASADEIAALASGGEQEPVKLLLEQLTELHDLLQRERTVRWNEFLRKVRAERRKEGEVAAASAAASERTLKAVDMPEVSLADGEMVGISGLGNKGKVGRAKWREFRALVLGGIPAALRSKIWSECSGASSMRVPGYYDDLVKGIGGSDPDSSVVAQIDMDINRTLTDNVFFRKGPGVTKLKEVLLAYSRRNPEVGYCQGMNLITASLLLITPTAEDTFWLLTSMIEVILPKHYYDHGLLASRADQIVLRQYISQVLPKLSDHLESLGVELEALTFQWFLSVFTDCLSAEALYRVWDVILCLDVASAVNKNPATASSATPSTSSPSATRANNTNTSTSNDVTSGSGGGSTFLFQVALALLKLNEQQLLTTCSTPAELYTYINHQMTNHAISIDGLIKASEALRNVVRPEDVVAKRTEALNEMQGFAPAEAIWTDQTR